MSQPPSEPLPCAEPLRWFAEEVQPNDAPLKAYLRTAFPSLRGEVDDIAQESCLRIWQARAARPIRSGKAFLFQVARRLAVDRVRRERASPIDTMPDLDGLSVIDGRTDVAEFVSTNEEVALLVEAFEDLPPRCREIMILRKLQNLPQKEVAHRLGITELTVQEQVYRGVRRCEKFLLRRGVIRALPT